MECVHYKKLENIIKIESGYSHFLALKRKFIEPLHLWDQYDVAKFIERCGFAEKDALIAIY